MACSRPSRNNNSSGLCGARRPLASGAVRNDARRANNSSSVTRSPPAPPPPHHAPAGQIDVRPHTRPRAPTRPPGRLTRASPSRRSRQPGVPLPWWSPSALGAACCAVDPMKPGSLPAGTAAHRGVVPAGRSCVAGLPGVAHPTAGAALAEGLGCTARPVARRAPDTSVPPTLRATTRPRGPAGPRLGTQRQRTAPQRPRPQRTERHTSSSPPAGRWCPSGIPCQMPAPPPHATRLRLVGHPEGVGSSAT